MKDNRDKLEDIAQDIVQRSGLKGLSFRTLAGDAGIKSSSVHYYFPEKSDLAKALIERYSKSVFEKLDDIAARRWSIKRKISAFIGIFEDVAKDDQLCLCGMLAAEIEHLGESNGEHLASFFLHMEQWLVDIIGTHQDEIQSSLSAKQLAKSMVSALEGALLLDRVAGNHQRLKAQKELFLSLLSK